MADTKIDLRDMQRHVDRLGARINALQQRVRTGTNREQELRTELATLEARHRELNVALARDGSRHERHPVIHKLATDLDASIGKFTDWVDAEEHPAARPGGFSP
jgi:chromosome segregation ATPase